MRVPPRNRFRKQTLTVQLCAIPAMDRPRSPTEPTAAAGEAALEGGTPSEALTAAR